MDVRLKFLGAAGTVTGSKYLLQIDQYNFLIDCGLFQGSKELRLRNWDKPAFDVEKIDAVILTHAHIDHSGYLPRLAKNGYTNNIHCTRPTADLLKILLLDSAKLQEEEANYARKKGYSKHADPKPLYTTDDAEDVMPLLKKHEFYKSFELAPGVEVKFYYAGHILGAASVEISIQGKSQSKKILFSGDIGRYDHPVLYDPFKVTEADVVLVESTYGNQTCDKDHIEDELADVVNKATGKGVLLIPAFSLGRTQSIIYHLNQLRLKKKIDHVNVYIDSPMAISVTDLYKYHEQFHKLKDNDLSDPKHPVFDSKNIHYCRTQEESRSLNDIQKGAIIISASGMCTGGRILHHLFHRIKNPENTVLFVGFQAAGTRGRRILEKESTIRIFGIDVPLSCEVKEIKGMSAHADKSELMRWMSSIKDSPKQIFVVHGETESSQALAQSIQDELKWNALVPQYLESFQLFEHI
ncbi:MAG TPA: MBL fold metallo-hydrolase [Cyclobacteriaceae bacterium]|nr:MBL fold metallo-hydrolase [Cyclobacteriaceae bacterium]